MPVQGSKVKSNGKSKVKSREKVIELIVQNPSITIPEIAAFLDMSMAGPDKGGHWEVLS